MCTVCITCVLRVMCIIYVYFVFTVSTVRLVLCVVCALRGICVMFERLTVVFIVFIFVCYLILMYYEPDIFCALSVSFEVYCFYLRICLTVLVLVLVLCFVCRSLCCVAFYGLYVGVLA